LLTSHHFGGYSTFDFCNQSFSLSDREGVNQLLSCLLNGSVEIRFFSGLPGRIGLGFAGFEDATAVSAEVVFVLAAALDTLSGNGAVIAGVVSTNCWRNDLARHDTFTDIAFLRKIEVREPLEDLPDLRAGWATVDIGWH
jgi:hypothetical protein